jgi:membrane protein YqaA with SNARE-associated domain
LVFFGKGHILVLTLGAYGGLFIAAFLAATILPAQSEAGLAAFIIAVPDAIIPLVLVASLGNIIGAVVNWYLGRTVQKFSDKWWFPATTDQLSRATIWYRHYGRWSLLLSWVPIIGDPLTLVAGILREPLPGFLIIVGLAKTTRYIVVAIVALNWV